MLVQCQVNFASLETLWGDRQIPVFHRDLPIPGERLNYQNFVDTALALNSFGMIQIVTLKSLRQHWPALLRALAFFILAPLDQLPVANYCQYTAGSL